MLRFDPIPIKIEYPWLQSGGQSINAKNNIKQKNLDPFFANNPKQY